MFESLVSLSLLVLWLLIMCCKTNHSFFLLIASPSYRYETRSYDTSSADQQQPTTTVDSQFSQMSLSEDGKLNLTEGSSTRLASMTQRVVERKTMTTTTESRVEKKSQQHSFRLE